MLELSNKRYFDLSPNELKRQKEVLDHQRSFQALELYGCGAMERILGAAAMSRWSPKLFPFGVNWTSRFYSARQALYTMHVPNALQLAIDTGLGDDLYDIQRAEISAENNDNPVWAIRLVEETDTDKRHITQYRPAGIKLNWSSTDPLTYKPIDLVEREDIELMVRHLKEIEELARTHELTAVDPHTLTVGAGVYVPTE